MGFETGPQYADGVWEGAETDKKVIDYLKNQGYGGIYFWGFNDPNIAENALMLADYAKQNNE